MLPITTFSSVSPYLISESSPPTINFTEKLTRWHQKISSHDITIEEENLIIRTFHLARSSLQDNTDFQTNLSKFQTQIEHFFNRLLRKLYFY